jgi:type III pantothenate kinase
VVPKVFNKIKSFLKTKNLKSYEIKELNLKKLVKINIENYNQLGSDRIANAIGSFYEHKKNCLVIDFGTATTFDIIKKPGSYEGGVIAPGVNLSINNLHKSTASLPFFNLKITKKIYGKNTKDALNAGFLWGYQGLIINIIKKIKETFRCKFLIILTGGYSKIFSKIINDNKVTTDPNITIKGIIYIYKNLII